MKILVDEMPQNSAQCLFSWKHIEYSNRMCRLGGFCKMTDISERGLWCFNTIDKLKKTGKHYDIASILEAMRK